MGQYVDMSANLRAEGAADSDALSCQLLLEHLLDTMPGGLFTVDTAGRITLWNKAMEDMTGYTAAEAVGQSCDMLRGDTCLLGPGIAGDGQCPLFSKRRVVGTRCTIRRKDGSVLPIHKNAKLLHSPTGELAGGIEVVSDISGVVDLEAEVRALRTESAHRHRFGGLVGAHPAMQRLYDMIELAAGNDLSVLIQGETGTGKELVAQAIHASSERRQRPMVRVCCAALSEGLLESELFGHVRGAFTGAHQHRRGRFEAADGGTILLDEIGDVPLHLQTKLLRVIQEREFERVGETRPIRVDIRVIAATNADLLDLCERGLFRRDLYYRLAVVPIRTPPLREHLSDIPALVEYFLARQGGSASRQPRRGVSADALRALHAHSWPGNVRELEHALAYANAVAGDGEIGLRCLPSSMGGILPSRASAAAKSQTAPGGALTPEKIRQALLETGGNKLRAAELLGTSRVTLWKWMKRFESV